MAPVSKNPIFPALGKAVPFLLLLLLVSVSCPVPALGAAEAVKVCGSEGDSQYCVYCSGAQRAMCILSGNDCVLPVSADVTMPLGRCSSLGLASCQQSVQIGQNAQSFNLRFQGNAFPLGIGCP